MYRLVFMSGRHRGKRLLVRRHLTIVGSSSSAHLRLDEEEGVAPEHVKLEENGVSVMATSLGPGIETLYNGSPITGEILLRDMDVLSVGPVMIQYRSFLPEKRILQRSPGLLQPLTFFVIAGMVGLQALLLWVMLGWPKYLLTPAEYAQMRHGLSGASTLDGGEMREDENNGQAIVAPSAGEAPPVVESVPESSPPAVIAITPATAASVAPEVLSALQNADFFPVDTNHVVELPLISAVDDSIAAAQKSLAAAVAAAEFADYGRAFSILSELQRTAPGFLPAYVENARLLEGMGQLERALEQWGQVIVHSTVESPFRAQATTERARLTELIQMKPVTVDSTRKDAGHLPDIRIANVSLQRLPGDEDVEDMRVLNFQLLTPSVSTSMSARLDITFYDRLKDGDIVPTTAIVTPGHVLYPNVFSTPVRSVSATYVVPRGTRQREERTGLGTRQYAGYTIHLAGPNGEIMWVEARPENLAKRYPIPPPSAAIGREP